jgi:hypothetical protein
MGAGGPEGKPVALADFKGKVVVMDFFGNAGADRAAWRCRWCRRCDHATGSAASCSSA